MRFLIEKRSRLYSNTAGEYREEKLCDAQKQKILG
jgi:hypothetical protein